MSTENGDSEHQRRPVGEVIDGRYQIIEFLGEGGMGAVYVAEHLTLHKEVALKVIHASYAGDGDLRARFAREALASAKLDHPHVASAIDFGSLPDGSAYLVIQLVRGPSLDEIMAEGKVDWRRATALGAQIADALTAAHGQGIVHRDLKPDNVLVATREDGSEIAKVLDFGIARVPSDPENRAPHGAETHRPLTKVGTVMGTPGYMSPEQALGERVDHRADLYALGVMLWEMITGRYLFEGELTSILQQQLGGTVASMREDDLDVPPELDELVLQLLSVKAKDRPVDATAVRDQLQQLILRTTLSGDSPLSGLTALNYAMRGTPSEGVTVPPSLSQAAPPPPAPKDDTKTGAALRLGIAALVLLSATGLTFALTRPGGPAAALTQVVNTVTTGSPELLEPEAPEALPVTLTASISTLINSGNPSERAAAASVVLNHSPAEEVPAHAIAVAHLDQADGCKPMLKALEEVRTVGDPAALPYIERLRTLPRRGCGTNRRSDCYSCIRGELQVTFRALTETADAAEPSAE